MTLLVQGYCKVCGISGMEADPGLLRDVVAALADTKGQAVTLDHWFNWLETQQ